MGESTSYLDNVTEFVFGSSFVCSTNADSKCKKNVDLKSVNNYINEVLESYIPESFGNCRDEDSFDQGDGRVGNSHVCFDVAAHVGMFIVGLGRQRLSSESNFSTIRANCGVYKGKWQYEIFLCSSGIMQLGWATINSEFSQESGVGDTPDSYAFDGNRVRKWNVSTSKYGEAWLKHDIIGCCIDLDEGCVEFYRNGKSLGVAFKKIRMGSGIVYFPTVSLALSECVVANFGSLQLCHPVAGFQPLQDAPHKDLWQSTQLFDWCGKLLSVMNGSSSVPEKASDSFPSAETTQLLIAHSLMTKLLPLLTNPYIVDAKHVPFLLGLCAPDNSVARSNLRPSARVTLPKNSVFVSKPRKLHDFLDLLLLFSENHEFQVWVEFMVNCLLMRFRCFTVGLECPSQVSALQLLNHLMEHKGLRHHFLKNVLFEKGQIIYFMNAPLNDSAIESLISKAWWETDQPDPSVEVNKRIYMAGVNKLKACVNGLEKLQRDLLFTLMDNSDSSATEPSSRRIFLYKFRNFLRDQIASSRLQSSRDQEEMSTLSWFFFFHMMSITQTLWSQELENSTPMVPNLKFYDGTLNYFSMDRLGGVLSHLLKTLRPELEQHLPPGHIYLQAPENRSTRGSPTPHSAVDGPLTVPASGSTPASGAAEIGTTTGAASLGFIATASTGSGVVFPLLARLLNQQGQAADISVLLSGVLVQSGSGASDTPNAIIDENEVGPVDSVSSLSELLDGLILFYHISAHKEMKKVSSVKDIMERYVKSLSDVQDRINSFYSSSVKQPPEILNELQHSYNVLFEHISKWSSQMAWIRAVVLSNEKQVSLVWLFNVVLDSLQASSECGMLFNFTPDFYLDCLVEMLTAVNSLLPPLSPLEDPGDYETVLKSAAKFIFEHICDARIRTAKAKDTFVTALTTMMSNSKLVHIAESVPEDCSHSMIHFLLQPYENRAWAHSNWVLVRMWQGSPRAFAFRHFQVPYHPRKLKPRLVHSWDFSLNFDFDPCPSSILQAQLRDTLLDEPEVAKAFINSVLNQLNWAFSEFIGMLQEIQNVSNRTDRVLVESRQLKTCATCFDLTLSLLRVLEMICTLALPVFVDPNRRNSEFLLSRLCQLLCQVLNRASSQVGCFHHVTMLEIHDLENVNHFPILTAVCGILLGILDEDIQNFKVSDKTVPVVTKELLSEPSFQMESVTFLMGGTQHFSFSSYKEEVTIEEISRVEAMLEMLCHYHQIILESNLTTAAISDEEVCTICYAVPISATFEPCNHHSCRACITHHLMNCRECFFCKAHITKVSDKDGKIIYSMQSPGVTSALPGT